MKPGHIIMVLFIALVMMKASAQPVPAGEENIPYLVTFGAQSSTTWGDDDFCQIFFFVIPVSQVNPVYLRIYDPETGNDLDELKGTANSSTVFSVYGGKGCWSDTSAQRINPGKNFKSGILITSRTFANETQYNKKWVTLGPFNPTEGEYSEKLGGRVFKIVAQGKTGDDGNLYRYFLSTSMTENTAVEGGNLFTYKYHFRLSDDPSHVSQIYPYVDDKTISVEVLNFDWDQDGSIRIYSVAKNGLPCSVSGQNHWSSRVFPITREEKNTTLEIQFVKNKKTTIRNNNVVVAIRNQYGTSLPFFVIPIGGAPVYAPKIRME